MGKNKNGRPRKPGERFLCGKLRPTGDPIIPAVWGRIRQFGAKLMSDPRLESEVGRLSFHRELNDVQTSAAFRVGNIYGAFERHRSLRRRSKSPSYEQGFSGDSGVAEELLEEDARHNLVLAQRASHEAFTALQEELKTFPRRERSLLEALCVEDAAISSQELPLVREMLDILADFFGVTSGQASKNLRRRRARRRAAAAKPAAAPAASAPRQADINSTVLTTVLRHARPDLDEEGLRQACELGEAVRAREIFKRSKEKRTR